MAIFAPPGLLKAEFACGVAPLPCPARAVSALPYSGNVPLHHVPRTGVTTLLSLLRGQQRCHSEPPRMRRVEESASAAAKRLLYDHACIPPPPPVISTEARSETTSGAEKSLTLYDCFCNVHLPVFYTLTLLSPCKILRLRALLFARHFAQDDRTCGEAACRRQGVPAAMFRESGGRSALFRENALLHYQAYCADSNDVILSRRTSGASRNLFRLPQSDYNATMPMLRPPLSFRPKRGVKRRAERRNLSHCTHAFAMYICPCSIPSPYCNPARSFDFAPCYSLGTSLRMTECTAFTRPA